MTTIRLELEELKIDRPKKRWNIYFIFATDHPSDESKYAVTMLPDPIMPVRRPAENLIDFSADGAGVEGLEILERPMPADRSVEVLCWVMHSRRSARRAGEIIEGIFEGLGTTATPVGDALLGSNPWWTVGKAAIGGAGAVGHGLKKVRDRDMGFVSLSEQFGPEFEEQTELDRTNRLSTGWGHLVWTWAVA